MLRPGGMLEDPEDDELGRAYRCNADFAHQAPVVDIVLRHRHFVAFDEERLVLRGSEQRANAPLAAQKKSDRSGNIRPQLLIVRLENSPLRSLVDRTLEKYEEPPHAHVLPDRVRRHCARAPDENAFAGELTNDVDASRVQY